MRRDEVVRELRKLTELRLQLAALRARVEQMEAAMEALPEDERDIIGTMYVFPRAGSADILCEKFGIERSSVYRRRDKALKKLGLYLEDLRDKSGMK